MSGMGTGIEIEIKLLDLNPTSDYLLIRGGV